MLSRFRWPVRLVLFTLAVVPMVACERVPLLAPSGSTLTLTSPTTALPVNGTAPIGVQVIEPSGTPPHSGTHITFTTTLGTLFPTEAETDSSGQAIVQFRAGTASGTATISAISGGASVAATGVLKILVGTAAVGKVVINASPSLVPSLGGSSTITTQVYDVNGNVLAAAPVSFSTTAGVLSSTLAVTDANGAAQVVLNTSTQAVVTASVGSTAPVTPPATGGGGGAATPTTPSATGTASASVTVGIAGSPTLTITPPATPPSAGLPGVFQFAVTAAAANASTVRSVKVDWGDGQTQDLGAITGTVSVAHTYRSAGTFPITAIVTDSFGNSVTVSTTVIVNPTALTLTITPPATTPSAGLPAIFQIGIGTLPAGDQIRNVHIDWGDTKSQDLGSISASTNVSHVYVTANTYTVTGTLTDTAGNSISNSTTVTVIPVAAPTIIITPSVPTIHSAVMNVSFSIQISLPTGVTVTKVTIDFGDGSSSTLGSATGTITVVHPYAVASGTPATITVSVEDSLGRTTQGQTSIILP
jgi:hypothetical protein